MEKLAPVAVFVYARPEHTKSMIESLANNELAKESNIWIFSDNAKNVKAEEKVLEVRKYISSLKEKEYFKSVNIVEAEKNKGLANSIISGVSDLINEYGKVIVLEDDLILSKNFLKFMNEALNYYKDDNKIWSISGYNLPIEIPKDYSNDVYLSYRGCSWGWATWVDRWNTIDWKVSDYNDFKNNYKRRKSFNRGGNDLSNMLDTQMNGLCDSWAIRWCYEEFKQNKYTIYPVNSFVQNEGFDGSGTHSGNSIEFKANYNKDLNEFKFNNELALNKTILKNFKKMYDGGFKQKIANYMMVFKLEKMVNNYRIKNKGKR